MSSVKTQIVGFRGAKNKGSEKSEISPLRASGVISPFFTVTRYQSGSLSELGVIG
jgi:hypothetical protein